MFMLIGFSEKAGSGVNKIIKGWREANWQKPYVEEERNTILMNLRESLKLWKIRLKVQRIIWKARKVIWKARKVIWRV